MTARVARLLVLAAAGASPMLLRDGAWGAARTWAGPGNGVSSGSWSLADDWSPNGVPDNGDDVFIPKIGLSNSNVTYDYTGPIVLLNSLHVSSNTTPILPRTSYLTMSANTLEATEEDFGDSGGGARGRGEMDQSGGTNNVTDLYLGKTAQNSGTFDFGTYSLSSSGFVNDSDFVMVGFAGGGQFNQTGGTLRSPVVSVGFSQGSNGTYNLSTGTIHLYSSSSTGTLTLGVLGNGTFLQSGGVVEPEPGNQTDLYLGSSFGANGTYSLSDGALSTFGGSEQVGYAGAGTFNQSGGTNDLGGGQLQLGVSAGGAGYYSLSGAGVLKTGGLGIGQPGDGTAVFDQNGGTITVGSLGVANGDSTARGTYKLEDGTLLITGSQAFIGGAGSASFIQNGGTFSAPFGNFILIGASPGSAATYSLSGGTLSGEDAVEYVGDSGVATFTQSGGANSLTQGSMYIGGLPNASGYYDLSGTGSLTVGGFLTVGAQGHGTFVMEGGTLSAGYLTVSASPASTGYFSQSDGQLNTGTEVIATYGAGSFVQSGGTQVVANTQIIGGMFSGAGSYLLSGGTLNSDLQLISTGTQTVGTFTMIDGTLELTDESVGNMGAGTFAQSGGTTTISNTCRIGEYSTGAGTMIISGGTLSIGELNDGWVGVGTFDLRAGFVHANSFTVDVQSILNINGGTLSTTTLTLGQDGGSTVNQFGGMVSSTNGAVDLGVASSSTSTYSMFDGTLSVVDGPEVIGDSGAGTFIQAQGSNIVSSVNDPNDSNLLIAHNPGSTGQYILAGTGSLSIIADEDVGFGGAGTFLQTGGTAYAGTLFVARQQNSTGTYLLSSNGSLTSSFNEYIGFNGAGTFIQSGGTNDFGSGQLELGELAGSAGYYTLRGTGIIKGAGIGVGQPGDSNAVFNQSGGTILISGLGIANGSIDSRGSYTLSGGSLTFVSNGSNPGIFVGGSGSGSFTQTGGTVSAPGTTPNLFVGYTADAVGTYSLGGGTFAFDNGSEYLGYWGNGALAQTGGIHTTGSLYIAAYNGSTGTYNLSGGALSAGNIYVGGTDTAAGGTASLGIGPAATLTVAGTLKAWDAGSVTLASPTHVGAVTTSGNGKIDITNSAMVVDYAPGQSLITNIASLIHSGYAGGAWTGNGITSSTAQADSATAHATAVGFAEASNIFSTFPATFMGLSIDSTSVLMRYTFVGDANLDGTVNALDFNALATNYGQTPGSDIWLQGDFNYDGSVDSNDFDALAANFGEVMPSGAALPLGEVVPEPVMGMLAVAGAAIMRRGRRRI